MIFNTCPNSEQRITKIVQWMKNIFQIHEASYGSPLKETKRKKNAAKVWEPLNKQMSGITKQC